MSVCKFRVPRVLLVFVCLAGFVIQSRADAQSLSTSYLTEDAIAAVYVLPGEIMKSPELRMMPTEVASAWTHENFGVHLTDVESLQLIVGTPGPAGPKGALIVTTTRDVDVAESDALLLEKPALDIAGYSAYLVEDTPGIVVHQVAPRTIVVAPADYLPAVLASEMGSGALADFVKPMRQVSPVMVAMVMEPIREQFNMAREQVPPAVPPQLSDLADLPNLLRGVAIAANLEAGGKSRIVMVANSEADAQDAEAIVNEALSFGRDVLTTQGMQNVQGEGEVPDALRQYIQRLGGEIVSMLTPQREGTRLTMELDSLGGIGTTGTLVGLLLPAVQSARSAARRMSSSNNLKQIMLAFHNYHDAYRSLPAAIIRDENGQPLLSWRVAILPFIEEAELYNEFHLDEPWDSEHNIKLLDRMPAVYRTPNFLTEDNATVYHAAVGDEFMFTPDGQTAFRNITDGLSNTIAVFEGNAATAVPWSSPEDAEIDMEDPLGVMGILPGGVFQVGLGDGAVRAVSENIDLDVLRALLTRSGGEVVPFNF